MTVKQLEAHNWLFKILYWLKFRNYQQSISYSVKTHDTTSYIIFACKSLLTYCQSSFHLSKVSADMSEVCITTVKQDIFTRCIEKIPVP